MRYSDDLIEEIRMKNDIVDVISGYVKLQRKGSSYFGLCPFHNEKSPSFSVSPGKQMYYCFGCGAGGNVFTSLLYPRLSFTHVYIYSPSGDNILFYLSRFSFSLTKYAFFYSSSQRFPCSSVYRPG